MKSIKSAEVYADKTENQVYISLHLQADEEVV